MAEIFDTQQALRALGNDRQLFQEILQVFLSEMAQLQPQLEQAIVAKDRRSARRLVHTLRGACRSVGGLHAMTVAADVEAHIVSNDFDSAQRGVPQLQDALHQLMQRIENSPALRGQLPVT